MAEMSDAEFERKVAEAMGWYVDPSYMRWLRRGPGPTISCDDWHPLEVDANGRPTERAAAQLWQVLMWLITMREDVRLSSLCSGAVVWCSSKCQDVRSLWDGADDFYDLSDEEAASLEPICAENENLPRAICLAAVAVGEEMPGSCKKGEA